MVLLKINVSRESLEDFRTAVVLLKINVSRETLHSLSKVTVHFRSKKHEQEKNKNK